MLYSCWCRSCAQKASEQGVAVLWDVLATSVVDELHALAQGLKDDSPGTIAERGSEAEDVNVG